MALEIERKFLLKDDSWRAAVSSSLRLSQGYLTSLTDGAKASVRVRIGGNLAYLNIKSMRLGMSRDEFEYPIPIEDAGHMLTNLCSGAVIEKIRHHVHFAGLLWEIDEFLGANQGLLMAEVELNSEDQTFQKPDWVGDEVTEDPRYYNVSLVRHPYTQWGFE
ncbi:MAG: adenylate cyclase [Halothiobacillus sp. 14-56-357]|jgi:adenylate cyclase|uniref:CYTH domain-containing protein n=1 Tax=Halothiobacillus sp. 15-55-196 TaxID=1970382 RepID=UPI000BC8B2BD|nr:CYTH domain-containing protein [Halothiobacillus sp. 15-55-196]OZB36767.1 MAG: adenylate cyclase [Halothiobacillus sp. 15-55-196]OZB57062.1 MAG: adenylate cyclase [Halothiobacillus sp. 14-56-357]OZB78393.1 MAG: adenylate cyclase [Halothiobacillus sp. 13-55-115]